MTTTQSFKNSFSTEQKNLSADPTTNNMHIMMSKKIAQLTKVIYSLNTKNDEHEKELAELNSKHQSELNKIHTESLRKLEKYQIFINRDYELQQKINQLDEVVSAQNVKLKDSNRVLEECKRKSEDKLRKNSQKWQEKVDGLTGKLEKLRGEYQQSVVRFEEAIASFNAEKATLLGDANVLFQKQFEQMARSHQEIEENLSNASNELHDKYKRELELLHQQIEQLKSEKTVQNEENEEKLRKMRGFHENEIATLKNMQTKGHNNEVLQWQTKWETLRKDYNEFRDEQKKKLEKLHEEIIEKDEEIKKMDIQLKNEKKTLIQLQEKYKSITEKSDKIKNDHETSIKAEKTLQESLLNFEQKCEAQIKEIVRKSEIIAELKAKQKSDVTQLVDLAKQIESLNKKLTDIEAEKYEMQHSTKSLNVEYDIQIQSLESSLRQITEEKEENSRNFNEQLSQLEYNYEKKLKEVRRELDAEREKIRVKSEKEYVNLQKSKLEELESLKQNSQKLVDEERQKASKIIEKMKQENENIKRELQDRSKIKEKEMAKFQKDIEAKEKELRSLSLTIKELTDKKKELSKELEKAVSNERLSKENQATLAKQLAESNARFSKLESEKADLQTQAQNEKNVSAKLSEITGELERKWSDNLKRETNRIRNEINSLAGAEKRRALDEMEQKKNEEIAVLQEQLASTCGESETAVSNWKRQLQIAEQSKQDQLSQLEKAHADRIGQMKKERVAERQRIDSEMLEEKRRFDEQLRQIHTDFEQQSRQSRAGFDAKLASEAARLQQQHAAEMERACAERDQAARKQLEEAMSRAERDREQAKLDAMQHFSNDLADNQSDFQAKMKQQQEETVRLKQQLVAKERQHSDMEKQRIAQFAELTQTNEKLTRQMASSESEAATLRLALTDKDQELELARADTAQQIRHKESELNETFEARLARLQEEADAKTEKLLEDFNRAQMLLKDKIAELRNKLAETEEAHVHAQRSARPQDVDTISKLQTQLRAQEKEMRRMEDDKKFFQMELANRETNFNKVFTAGVNAPKLSAAIKTKAASTIYASNDINGGSSNSHSALKRLAPIPGSPFHEDPLNPAKPLPAPHRKSVI